VQERVIEKDVSIRFWLVKNQVNHHNLWQHNPVIKSPPFQKMPTQTKSAYQDINSHEENPKP